MTIRQARGHRPVDIGVGVRVLQPRELRRVVPREVEPIEASPSEIERRPPISEHSPTRRNTHTCVSRGARPMLAEAACARVHTHTHNLAGPDWKAECLHARNGRRLFIDQLDSAVDASAKKNTEVH